MKIVLLSVGTTAKKWVKEGEDEYAGRLSRYIVFERAVVPDLKNSGKIPVEQQKTIEGEAILARLLPTDRVVLLDERGELLTSRGFASKIQQAMNSGIKRLVFIIGGPYGFSQAVYNRAGKNMLSLSKMTFPHDLVRALFVEQLYRAFTILNNEPYHHD